MQLFAYAPISYQKVLSQLGKVEYSYSIVLKAFHSVLERIAPTRVVENPGEVDTVLARAPTPAVFLSFTPPHLTRPAERCRTVPVFAWEFDTIPTDRWYDDPKQDWRTTLEQCGSAIVHSHFTAATVRTVMGADFPVAVLPAPVWDDMAPLRSRRAQAKGPARLRLRRAVVLDTADGSARSVWPDQSEVEEILSERAAAQKVARLPVLAHEKRAGFKVAQAFRAWRSDVCGDIDNPALNEILDDLDQYLTVRARPRAMRPRSVTINLSGVVFTTVFNARDGRKNWQDMLSAFCEAFAEHPDATLLMKLSHWDCGDVLREIMLQLARTKPFQCRVIVIEGSMDERAYAELIEATTFVVNASHGEGQCLPLMEFMAAGRPAIAPHHTAMLDYVTEDAAFLLRSWLEVNVWPHDPRLAYRTLRHQIDWTSVVEAYRRAYAVAKNDPAAYDAMATAAIERTRQHCSRDVVEAELRKFLAATGTEVE